MTTCIERQEQTDIYKDHFTMASYFFSVFNTYFGSNHVSSTTKPSTTKNKLFINNKKSGLMPHSPTRKLVGASITPQTVTAPITMASVGDTTEHDDCCYYLSKSDSSTSSSGSSWSSISDHSLMSMNMSSSRQRKSVSSLSEILCEHYVQKTLHSNNGSSSNANNNNNDEIIDVPLETYKVFEASRRRSSSGNSSLSTNSDNNQTAFEKAEEEDDDEEEESWFIWDNLQKTKEWIQVVDEELFLPQEKVTTEIAVVVGVEQVPLSSTDEKKRGIRANPAHLRMIVAEVNMMRCNKIVGPLKPRGFLPARTDPFVSKQSSPLVKKIIYL